MEKNIKVDEMLVYEMSHSGYGNGDMSSWGNYVTDYHIRDSIENLGYYIRENNYVIDNQLLENSNYIIKEVLKTLEDFSSALSNVASYEEEQIENGELDIEFEKNFDSSAKAFIHQIDKLIKEIEENKSEFIVPTDRE
jgi:hypothetical protein